MSSSSSVILSNPNNLKEYDLYDGFLRFNRRLISILKILRPPLNTNESHVLAAITTHPNVLAKDLVEIIGLDKSVISRLLKQLVERGLIAEAHSSLDRRQKYLAVSSEGQRILHEDSILRNREVEVAVAPLSRNDQNELLRLLKHIADSLGEPPVDQHPEDHPLKREIRRLTRGMGFIGENCMNTGLPVEVCQVLRLTNNSPGGVPFSELNRTLPYDASALSRLISHLSEDRQLEKQRAMKDHRILLVRATPIGARRDSNARKRAAQFFQLALKGLPAADAERLSDLVWAFTHKEFDPTELGDAGQYIPVILSEESQRQHYRGILLESLVHSGEHRSLPESILASDSLCVAITRQGESVAIAEIVLSNRIGTFKQLRFLRTLSRAHNEHTSIIESLLEALRKSAACDYLEITDNEKKLIPSKYGATEVAHGLVRITIK